MKNGFRWLTRVGMLAGLGCSSAPSTPGAAGNAAVTSGGNAGNASAAGANAAGTGSGSANGGAPSGTAGNSAMAGTSAAPSGGSGMGSGGTSGNGPAVSGGAGAMGGDTSLGGEGGTNEGGAGDPGGAPSTGGAGTQAGGGAGGAPAGTDERPWFSFFVTSLPGMREECGSEDGCGGNLGGLSGADEICAHLAQVGNPGDQKVWKAFLSATGMYGDMVQVDAIDRIGDGPWWDWHGRMFAPDVESLLNDRPEGGDPALQVMFTDETGVDIQSARNGDGQDDPDNHDSLTGSGQDGRLAQLGDDDGSTATCLDWTSATERGSGTGMGGGEVPVGHAWPRQAGSTSGNGANWIQDHTVNGCEPGILIGGNGGACDTCFAVGDGGGFGGFFCFALDAVAPE